MCLPLCRLGYPLAWKIDGVDREKEEKKKTERERLKRSADGAWAALTALGCSAIALLSHVYTKPYPTLM